MNNFYKVWIHDHEGDPDISYFNSYKEALEYYNEMLKYESDTINIELSRHKNKNDFEGITLK